jgi:hypothetical protein
MNTRDANGGEVLVLACPSPITVKDANLKHAARACGVRYPETQPSNVFHLPHRCQPTGRTCVGTTKIKEICCPGRQNPGVATYDCDGQRLR